MMASTTSGDPPSGRGEYGGNGNGSSSGGLSPRGRLLGASKSPVATNLASPMRRKRAAPVSATAAASTTTATTRRCSRNSAVACVLGFLALGFAGPAVLRRAGATKFVSFDQDVDLPEGAIRSAYPVSRDKKPGWMDYHNNLKAQAEEEGAAARVLVLGDSITEEMLGTSLGKPRKDTGDTLAVWLEYYDYLGAINLGVSGDQTQHLLWRLMNGELPDVLQPEVIQVAIGTNNLGAGMSVQDTVEGVRAIIEYLREERPDAFVCVMALFPRADTKDQTSIHPWPVIDEVNASLLLMLNREFGDEKVVFIDCTARFLAEDETGHPVLNSATILPDNLHLTRDGLQAWAECVEPSVHSGLSRRAG